MSIIDGIALTAKLRFGADSSPGSTWTIPTSDGAGTNFVAGDLAIVYQLAEGAGATPPTLTVPAGWTAIGGGTSFTSGDGKGVRVIGMVKILTATDIGNTFVGMNGASKNRVCGMALHFTRPLRGLSAVDHGTSGSAGVPASLTINWDSALTGAHLMWGACHGDLVVHDFDYGWTVGPSGSDYVATQPDLGSETQTRTQYSFYPIGTGAVSVGMSASDVGNFNALFGILLRLT